MTKVPFDPEHPGVKILTSNLVWDLVPHEEAPELLSKLKLTPPSAEGASMECRNSHLRMSLVDPLDNNINFMARQISEIAIKVILGDAEETLDEKIVSHLMHQYDVVVTAALKVAIANFLATGMLVYQRRI
ncbi:hypothetical protein [Nonomuraea typhae]|uniref:Uncharacterized protein n=1 Tax=Nonomuraea typhae TaxID=2603600 RepID=A0ABW7YJB3_9ACTN